MRNNNAVGMVFPNQHDACLGELTAIRSFGSVPFGGRYRLIDFVLSNMVNAGISKVGIATKTHCRSLMDHLGSGKAWDLDRKNGGLYFLPSNTPGVPGRITALQEHRSFLTHSKEDYVVLADCNVVGNLDYAALIRRHIDTGADITVAYKTGALPAEQENLLLTFGPGGRVMDIRLGAGVGNGAYGIGLYVMRRELLIALVEEAHSRSKESFERDILQHSLGELMIFGYEVHEYTAMVHSIASYFDANMALLRPEVRRELFLPDRRIYTKVRDCAPVVYGLHADVSDSLLADGVVVDGSVSHSILFRDVSVGRGVTLERCIVMQGSEIGAGARLTCVICDKDVKVGDAATMQGVVHYPAYVKKGKRV